MVNEPSVFEELKFYSSSFSPLFTILNIFNGVLNILHSLMLLNLIFEKRTDSNQEYKTHEESQPFCSVDDLNKIVLALQHIY